jgi:MurNAc alpha-1-phosphate uridylyltransferase
MISGRPHVNKKTAPSTILQAIILAAGFGTRLLPLTSKNPKALIPLNDKPLLEIVLNKMLESGIRNIAVNGHHHARQMERFLKKYTSRTKALVYFSHEEKLLDTGGGIKKMIPLLHPGTAILVQNVDILTDLNLRELYDFHLASGAACTMAIQTRPTDRPLLFDEKMLFCGRGPLRTAAPVRKPKGELREFGFCGVQVIAPELFLEYPGDEFNSIDVYLRASSWDKKIIGYCVNSAYWRDLGQLSDLQQAEKDIRKGFIEI